MVHNYFIKNPIFYDEKKMLNAELGG